MRAPVHKRLVFLRHPNKLPFSSPTSTTGNSQSVWGLYPAEPPAIVSAESLRVE